MHRLLFVLLLLLIAVAPACAQNWQLVWSDEFNGVRGAAPDPAKWGYDTGATGWGNKELENYTASTNNSFLDGSGNLVIRASQVSPAVAVGSYTSARILTKGKFSFTYGKIEARIKIPFGQGLWPAFWMLGDDIDAPPVGVGWPKCGEIDVMENIGKEPSIAHGTVHGPITGSSSNYSIGAGYTLPGGQKFSDDSHTFTAVWTADSVEFFVDGNSYKKVLASSLAANQPWVFNHPFFVILNVAVGGTWPGNPDSTTQFPQDMTVDYVRVYRAANGPAVSAVWNAAPSGAWAQGYSLVTPGGLASVYGTGLSSTTTSDLFDSGQNAFRSSSSGVAVTVNGVAAPLIFISPAQINFQVPWETPTSKEVPVQVTGGGTTFDPVAVAFLPAAPSAFPDYSRQTGVALLSCQSQPPKAGEWCVLWGNGFGAKQTPQKNGTPSPAAPLPWVTDTNNCTLTIGGVAATVFYCGAAPGLVIDQLNFWYPAGVPGTSATVIATLTIKGLSGQFLLPAAR